VTQPQAVAIADLDDTQRDASRPVAAIVLACIALDVVANSVLPRRLHIPVSMATAAGVSWLGAKAGVSMREQGMSPHDAPRGLLYGIAASLPSAIALVAASRHHSLGTFYQQEAIAKATPGWAAYEAFVRVPFGTALPEEIIFRGTSMALLARRRSRLTTLAVSSLLFGLWHIVPTAQRLDELPHVRRLPAGYQLGHIAGSVASTALAGVVLGWLRQRSGSIVAAWLAHTTANAAGYVAAWLAARSRRRPRRTIELSTAQATYFRHESGRLGVSRQGAPGTGGRGE
jgi:membrane protease YdiL (CAAX protease family)